MLPALRNVVPEKERPIALSSAELLGATNAQGVRCPLASGGVRSTSRHAGSSWRSYQATYSSTVARVAGGGVAASIRPSPRSPTRRPARSEFRHAAAALHG